ncbi:MAG: lamin tail domain-containing protein [Alcanivoracaceae bacterium]|nr:lamin tail domain-containing protein [Alcanivoracaceae bacterium]
MLKNNLNQTSLIHLLLLIIFCYTPMSTLAGVGNPQNIAINEVFYQGNASEDWVELVNRGNEAIDISGWRWCSRFVYPTIQASNILSGNADLILEPGEIIALSTSIDLNNSASDLGLYTSTPFSSAANMVDFVQWGTSTDVGRSDVARDKGIWLELQPNIYDFVVTSASNETLSWCGTESGGGFLTTSIDFVNTLPSQGVANNNLTCEIIFANSFE